MIKTLTFGVMHVSVAFAVVYAMTGDALVGGAVAMVEPLVNTLAYHVHETVWGRIRAGAAVAATPAPPMSAIEA